MMRITIVGGLLVIAMGAILGGALAAVMGLT